MLDIFKGEWKLFLKKYMLIFLAAVVLSEVAGFALVKIVLHFDVDSTYIYAGVFILLYVIFILGMIFLSYLINTRFSILVNFGKRRKDVSGYCTITGILSGLIFFLGTIMVFIYENTFYSQLFAGYELEPGFGFGFIENYGFVIIMFATLLVWFMYVLGKRFGGTIFAIFYMGIGIFVLIISKFYDTLKMDSFISPVLEFLIGIPAMGWACIALILSAIFVMTGYNILKKIDVKF